MRWLLLEEVVRIQKSRKALTRSRVPARLVSAEPLLMEMMAQTGGLLLGAERDFQDDIIFAKIESADFFEFRSGETIEIEAVAESLKPEGSWLEANVCAFDGRKIAMARFLLMSTDRLSSPSQEPIVFHKAFMNHFKVREKVQ